MATADGFTAARMLMIENSTVVGGTINGSGDLILETRDGSTYNAGHVSGADGTDGLNGTQGTRVGTTNAWVFDITLNAEVFFADGEPPRVGDLVVSSNGLGPGDIYFVTAVVDATHADLDRPPGNPTLRGPEGPPGDPGTAEDAWPVDSVYLAMDSTNPATKFGFGTWVRIAEGQMLLGQKTSDTDFDTAGETGGSKTHTLAVGNLPDHQHNIPARSGSTAGGADLMQGSVSGSASTKTTSGMTSGGTATPVNHMNPYFVVYVWRRTA